MKKVDYAIVLMERLKNTEGALLDMRTVAAKHSFPPAFLEKIAQELKSTGWIEGRRGRRGGYRISKAGKTVTIADIINFFERPYEVCPVLRVKKHEARITKK